MKLTELEIRFIKAYKADPFVSDSGWEDENSRAWVKHMQESTGLTGKILSGVMSSLVQKGIVTTNGEGVGLTKTGIEIAGGVG